MKKTKKHRPERGTSLSGLVLFVRQQAKLYGQLLKESDPCFDTFYKASFFILPTESTDDIDDTVRIWDGNILQMAVECGEAVFDLCVVQL